MRFKTKSPIVTILPALLFSLLCTAVQAQPVIGVAKDENRSGREVRLDFYLENLGTEDLMNLSLPDDLDAVFGAGTYTIFSGPTLIDDPGTITLNSAFDGSTIIELISAGTLAQGDTAQIRLLVQVDTFTDLGMGLGVYTNQVTASAEGQITPGMISDLSDDGTDPDPNGNGDPTDVGEDDPTLMSFLANPIIGAAKSALLNGTQVTLDFYLENFGNTTLSNISMPDDLDAVFGAGNYIITSLPAFIDNPGTLTLNAGFDGSADTQLISGGTLAASDTAQIQIVVDVTNVTDQGNGLGVYTNQVTASATDSTGTPTSDLSDSGIDPDPNGNGRPDNVNENDATVFTIGDNPVIGVAKDVSVSGDIVTLDFYLENLGNIPLQDLVLDDDLDSVFGTLNYQVTTAPTLIDDPGTISVNAAFDGSSDDSLITSGTLAAGDTAQIRVVVTVIRVTDQGLGLGNFSNQVTITAQTASAAPVSDVSDFGTDPDPNGNNNPAEAGENDPTTFSIALRSGLGVAKTAVVANQLFAQLLVNGAVMNAIGDRVRLEFFLENTGNVDITNLALIDDLNAVFGVGNFGTFIGNARVLELIEDPGTIDLNPMYDGATNTNVFLATSSLRAGETARILFELSVINLTDQGFGVGIYRNTATVSGNADGGGMVTDDSDNGTDPDPNGNGDPTDPGEDDPTPIDFGQFIGAALDINTAINVATFDYYLESFGTLNKVNLDLQHNLDTIFGAGNYTVNGAPALIDDPGTIVLNPGFDGSSDEALIGPGSSLTGGDTAQIRLVVTVDNVAIPSLNGLGFYQTGVTVEAETPTGQGLLDASTAGTDPDPTGDDRPDTFGTENTLTSFNIAIDSVVGAAKDANVAGTQVTIDFYLENLGTLTSSDLSLTDNLDDAFGAGNYVILSPPTFIDDPGTVVLNGGYDGSSDIELLAAGSSLVAADTAQIQMVVDIINVTDVGLSLGIYENQATVVGMDPNNYLITDLSDDGTDPDPNGDGNPGQSGLADPPVPGENDPTMISIGVSSIGIAKHATVIGTRIALDYYVENLGNLEITGITVADTLFTVFGFGNIAMLEPATLISGPATMTPQAGFDGVFATTLVFNGVLQPGETAQIRYVLDVTTVTNQGSGFGIYTTQTAVSGTGADGTVVIDNSDDGVLTDPNGNGDATDPGEDDATLAIIGEEANLGVAKDATVAANQVTLDYYLENLGNVTLSTLDMSDNLDEVFGAGNYTINTTLTFIDDPGTITLNPGFDGSADSQIIGAGSTLAAADTAQIQLIIDVTNIELIEPDLQIGDYRNQVVASSTGPSGSVGADFSDDGADPDPNGNGDPAEAGEQDATVFSLGVSLVGVAKNATTTPNSSLVTIDYFIENLGNTTLVNYSLDDNLDIVFGPGNYQLVSGPTQISLPRNLVLNQNFDGSTDTALIMSGAQDPNVLEQIRIVVDVTQFSDQGMGVGVYSNQVTVIAEDLAGTMLSDVSDNGTDPDPNGNDMPDDADESDPTIITLMITPPPGFTKAFSVDPILIGGVSTLTFTIDNSGATADATALDFTDNLPAGLVVATPNNASTTCTGGTLTATPGTAVITYTGGAAPVIGMCTVTVDITATAAGNFVNTTSDLTSAFGNSGTASDTLLVNPPPTFAKAFAPNPTIINGVTTLTFTIDNTASTVAATALDFTDNLPATLAVATPANALTTCTGGTLTAAGGATTISYTGGTVSAGAACTVSVDILATAAGDFVNTTGDLTSSSGNSGMASDSLRVNPPPLFSKLFNPDLTAIGAVVTLTFTIDNTASTATATNLDFTDNFPANLEVAATPNAATTCTGGTITAAAGSTLVTYTGGTAAAAATCTVSVDVTSTDSGALVNTSGDLTSSLGNSGPATDTLNVDGPPPFSKAFAPTDIPINGVSTLTFTIDNSGNLGMATALDFTDNLPAGIVVATPANASTTCGFGTLTATAGSSVISYTGGTADAASTCTVQADVTGSVPGDYINTSGDLTSSLGNSGPASATLTIAAPPGFAKAFAPSTITLDGISTLTFTIDNSGNQIAAAGLDFTDNLPAGLEVAATPNAATTCTGGTITAVAGGTVVSYTGGTVAAASTCTVQVDITGSTPGDFVNTSGDLTSLLGNSGTAADTLTIAPPPVFGVALNPDVIFQNQPARLIYTIDNSASPLDADALEISTNLPPELEVANPTDVVVTCTGGTVTAVPRTTFIGYTGGTVAAGAICEVQLNITSEAPGTYVIDTGDLISNAGNSGNATVTITVNFSPIAVPVNSGWMLLLMMLMLGAAGAYSIQRLHRLS